MHEFVEDISNSGTIHENVDSTSVKCQTKALYMGPAEDFLSELNDYYQLGTPTTDQTLAIGSSLFKTIAIAINDSSIARAWEVLQDSFPPWLKEDLHKFLL